MAVEDGDRIEAGTAGSSNEAMVKSGTSMAAPHVAGVAALLIGGGRFSYGLLGLLGFVVAMGSGIMMPFALYGMLFCVATMAALGMDGEMRRSAGCRDD